MKVVLSVLLLSYLYTTNHVTSLLDADNNEIPGKLPKLNITNRFTLFDVNGRNTIRDIQPCDYNRYRQEMRPLWIGFFKNIFDEAIHTAFDRLVEEDSRTNTTLDELCAFEKLYECVKLPVNETRDPGIEYYEVEDPDFEIPPEIIIEDYRVTSRLDGVCRCMNDKEIGIIQNVEKSFCIVPENRVCNPWAESLQRINKDEKGEKFVLPIVPEELFCDKDSGCHPHTFKCECAIGYKCGAMQITFFPGVLVIFSLLLLALC